MSGEVYYNADHGILSIRYFQEEEFSVLSVDKNEKIGTLASFGQEEIWKTQEITEDCVVDWIGGDTLVHVEFFGVDDGIVKVPPNLPQKEQIMALLQSPKLAELGITIST